MQQLASLKLAWIGYDLGRRHLGQAPDPPFIIINFSILGREDTLSYIHYYVTGAFL